MKRMVASTEPPGAKPTTMVIGPREAKVESPHRPEMVGVWDHAYDRIDQRR